MGGFWITMHWAHGDPDDHPWNIYRKELEKRDHEVAVGDRVLFYECRRGNQKTVERIQGGVRTPVKIGPGAAGIVRVGTVAGERRQIRDSDILYDYGNGVERWKYVTPCTIDANGLIPLNSIRRILGSGLPAQSFGLKSISAIEYDRLFHELKSSQKL